MRCESSEKKNKNHQNVDEFWPHFLDHGSNGGWSNFYLQNYHVRLGFILYKISDPSTHTYQHYNMDGIWRSWFLQKWYAMLLKKHESNVL